MGYRGYCIKFQSVSSLHSDRLLEELGSHRSSSCFHGNNLDYRFLASQAKSPCMFSFDLSMKLHDPFACDFYSSFIIEGCVCMCVCVCLADFTKGLGKIKRYLHLQMEIMSVDCSLLPHCLTCFLQFYPSSTDSPAPPSKPVHPTIAWVV